MNKNILVTVFFSAILTLFSGCASVGNDSLKKESEQSVSEKIIKGKTTKFEIKRLFGSPSNTSFTDGGLEIWKYHFTKSSGDLVNYIPIVNWFGSSSSGTKKELTVLFSEEDVVKKFNMAESDISVKTGLLR